MKVGNQTGGALNVSSSQRTPSSGKTGLKETGQPVKKSLAARICSYLSQIFLSSKQPAEPKGVVPQGPENNTSVGDSTSTNFFNIPTNTSDSTNSTGGFFEPNTNDLPGMPSGVFEELETDHGDTKIASDQPKSGIGDLNQELNGRKLGHVLTHHFIKDNQHGSTTLQIIGMSNAANAVFCEMDTLPGNIKGAVEASDRVEQTLASGEGFSTAFNTHFESHSVLTLSGLGTTSHSIGANVYKKDDGFHVVLCNRGLGANDHGHFFEVVIPDQQASVAMNTLVELKNQDKIDKVYDALANFKKIEHDDIASSQLVGNCGWANKEAALKELAFKMCGGNQGIKGVYKPFRAAMKAKLETYVDSLSKDDELKDAMARYNDFQTHTDGIKKAIRALPKDPKDNDFDAVLGELMTGILSQPDEAGAEAHLERYSNYVKKVIDENNPPKGINRSILINIHNSFIELQKGLRDESLNSTELLNTFKNKITQFKSSSELATSFRDNLSGCESFDDVKTKLKKQSYPRADFQLFRHEIIKTFNRLKGTLKTDTQAGKDVYNAWVGIANAGSMEDLQAAFNNLTVAESNQAKANELNEFRDELSERLNSAALATFKEAVVGMTDEQFAVSRSLVQNTAQRLFEGAGGAFTESRAWMTNTPIKEGLYGVYAAKNKTQLVAAFETLNQMMEITQAVDDATSAAGLNQLFNKPGFDEMPKSALLYLINKSTAMLKTSDNLGFGAFKTLHNNYTKAIELYNSRLAN